MKRFVSPRSKAAAKNKASGALTTPTIITGPHETNHQLQPDRLLATTAVPKTNVAHKQQQQYERLVDIQTTNNNNYQLQPDRLADALLAAAPRDKVQTRLQPERLVNAAPKLNGKFMRR